MLTPRPVATTILVEHYKDAAERHFQICNILFEQLNYPQNFRDTNKYYNILAELYYLSGYIIECTINYKYLIDKGFLDSDDYNQPTRWDTGVRLKGHFRFTAAQPTNSSKIILQQLSLSSIHLPAYLQVLGGILPISLSLTGDDLKKQTMQQHWDPSVRYAFESTGLPFNPTNSADDIKIYYKAAKELFNHLI